jgi:hypothetical protein
VLVSFFCVNYAPPGRGAERTLLAKERAVAAMEREECMIAVMKRPRSLGNLLTKEI